MKQFHIGGDLTPSRDPFIIGENQAIDTALNLRFEYEKPENIINKIKTIEVGEFYKGRVIIFRLKDSAIPIGAPFDEDLS